MTRIRVSLKARIAMASAMASLGSNGSLTLYSGEQPGTADQDGVNAVALVTVPLSKLTVGADAIILMPSTVKTEVSASGNPAWYRWRGRNGETLTDGSVGVKDADLILWNNFGSSDVFLHAGSTIKLDRLAFTINHRS